MLYKYNCNKRCDYIKKGLGKGKIVGSAKRRQNCVGKGWKNVESDGS